MASDGHKVKSTDGSRCILLIGATGQGKSSLASFLTSPTDALCKPTFARSSGLASCTTEILSHQVVFDNTLLDIIDTPGLNDTSNRDADHMFSLIKTLSTKRDLAAIVICVRIDSKMDAQFKYTLSYYCDMFRACLETNLVLVVTNVRTDRRSVIQRARDGFNLDKSANAIRDQVSEIVGFPIRCAVWLIDSLVEPGDEQEFLVSMDARHAILKDCIARPVAHLGQLALVKTQRMQKAELDHLAFTEGQIQGFTAAMVERNELSDAVRLRVNKAIGFIADYKTRLTKLEVELGSLDTSVLVPVKSLNLRAGWTLTWTSTPFTIETPCPFESYSVVASAAYSIEEKVQTPTSLSGKFLGTWFSHVQASITCYAQSRTLHATPITELQEAIMSLKSELSGHQATLDSIRIELDPSETTYGTLWRIIRQLVVAATRVGERKIALQYVVQFLEFLNLRGIDRFRDDLWNTWLTEAM